MPNNKNLVSHQMLQAFDNEGADTEQDKDGARRLSVDITVEHVAKFLSLPPVSVSDRREAAVCMVLALRARSDQVLLRKPGGGGYQGRGVAQPRGYPTPNSWAISGVTAVVIFRRTLVVSAHRVPLLTLRPHRGVGGKTFAGPRRKIRIHVMWILVPHADSAATHSLKNLMSIVCGHRSGRWRWAARVPDLA
eukprot:CAMPEP_0204328732 /NCGR_PEP_ID=MMETSP0469-20131031/13597_1 /ASSEMBLY_ACC=CAM_ASM_000384 /TAXON_ID=2969 /ORGANISM="Oxyrrhis marina" /LENGTH=191 /DNA_ID=CAMNT_0051311185 /DNA_START=79 /DNA_END=654 /DNA_ORIENTATION=-